MKLPKIVKHLLFIVISQFVLLFSPKVDGSYYVHMNKYMRVIITGDALTFVNAATNPKLLLQKDYSRQSRPLYIISGTILGNLLYTISLPFHNKLEQAIRKKIKTSTIAHFNFRNKEVLYTCIYLSFVIINILSLLLSMHLFEKIIPPPTEHNNRYTFIKSIFLFMISCNGITKYFLLNPHQQVFNILIPLTCSYLVIWINTFSWAKIKLLSLCFGMLLLAYGGLLITLPVLLVSNYLYASGNQLSPLREKMIQSLQIIFLFSAPFLCWYFYLQIMGVGFYSDEVTTYHQFVWIWYSLTKPSINFFDNLLLRLKYFSFSMAPTLVPSIMLLMTLTYNLIQKKTNSVLVNNFRSDKLYFTITSSFIVFQFFLGYYSDRLCYTIATTLLCYSATLLLARRVQWGLIIAIATPIMIWYFILFFQHPFHFSEKIFRN